jgi:hypothetical protein
LPTPQNSTLSLGRLNLTAYEQPQLPGVDRGPNTHDCWARIGENDLSAEPKASGDVWVDFANGTHISTLVVGWKPFSHEEYVYTQDKLGYNIKVTYWAPGGEFDMKLEVGGELGLMMGADTTHPRKPTDPVVMPYCQTSRQWHNKTDDIYGPYRVSLVPSRYVSFLKPHVS